MGTHPIFESDFDCLTEQKMDIRKWLNKSPKGLKTEPKSPKLVQRIKTKKKRSQLDSSSDDDNEEQVVTKVIKPAVQSKGAKSSKTTKSENKENKTNPVDFFSPSKVQQNQTKKAKRTKEEQKEEEELLPAAKKQKLDQKISPTKKEVQSEPPKVVKQEVKKEAIEDEWAPMEEGEPSQVKDTDGEEKKKFNYFAYKAKQDAGPRNPGSKEIPKGAENCLEGVTIVITGTGDSLGRDETKSLIERYGGKVTSAVSGKTSYLVVGDEPGESKIKKAKDKNVVIIDEDALLELIRSRPGKRSKYEIEAENEEEVTRKAK